MILNRFQLGGKTSLITGASRGLGRAISLGFAEAGADLVLVSRNKKALEKVAEEILKLGKTRVWTVPFNLAEIENIPQWYDNLIQEIGMIDILVNVAGTIFRTEAESYPLEKWHEVINLNLTSVFVLSQSFARQCIQRKSSGKIINIASLLSEAARPSIPAYTASKGGIRQLTKALAVEWAKNGICVNAIGPGYFETELTSPLINDEKFNRWVCERTPMGRWGKPDELAGAALFLASPASDFITGQIIYVDGGWLASL